ncbi:hypothetical protein THRCLA_21020 [Thraustotheca clavata]|uniref:PX domain-containing protein n=1 Tax=Thraustotheca clavata TaxID=74557 RepID=A0A1W0A1M2_9STRA|nr:hypothetical protein THRCLA_21020 [Thraustotheca clavata]
MSEAEALKVEVFGSYEALDQDSGKFYTEYILRCTQQDGLRSQTWKTARRYREFCAIDVLLREKYPHLSATLPPLPSKKYLGSSLASDFVEKRQRELGQYITTLLLLYPELAKDEIVDEFLELSCH